MQKISPFLWFNGNAEEAANFYVSVFKNSHIVSVTRYPEGLPGPAGSVMTVNFVINGEEFTALNGGAGYPFTQAVSFVVNCDTQAEVDDYWAKLSTNGGQEVACGWLRDKFGLSWQIVPDAMLKMITSDDTAAMGRAMAAMVKMKKLDIAALQQAFDNK